MNGHVLVVGASHAGVQLAARLRERGHRGPVTLVGDETPLPYHRPPLSKAYLAGSVTPDSMSLRPETFYATKEISLLRGTRVEEIDLEAGTARTSTGDHLTFDHLALTTGAAARRLEVPGAELRGVAHLRDMRDATGLRDTLGSVRRAVVVGGGFIGLEAAAVLRQRGVEVTVVEFADRLMARSVSREMSDFFADLHRDQGSRVLLETGVVALEGTDDGCVGAVALDDGTALPADLVVVGIGVVPRTGLADQLGLQVDGGVLVDRRARTSDPRVVAAGDVTLLPHPLEPGTLLRLESVQNATDQSDIAAATLCGQDVSYDAVPWFWSDQFDLKLQMAGAATRYDDVVVRGSAREGGFTVLCYRDDRLVAGECVNAGSDFVAVRRALAAGTSFPRDLAADISVKLKTLL
ncbi:Rhodocoxin reductase [Nocardioides dokdonensis FR1436]|uniref:Rhodocoxin reductase n=1 Tax=Nocardioides dokdonensis FR1436 TaxID=1300347 RepID=A0A1A9GJG9_9ACTN|nr:FAD-dependent oxidoreductase [Nocardioides dokdonensis]ANH37615.1 Rhodocoxin reductase [Nocardioides dokdonensis FR1436]